MCDTNAYQKDNTMPTVAGTFTRQNVFYDKILRWELEAKTQNLFKDITQSKVLPPILKNVFLALYDPQEYISMVSPKHREVFIKKFIDSEYHLHDFSDVEKACIESNKIIKDYF